MRKHIKTVNKAILNKTLKTGGCGECPACKLRNHGLEKYLARRKPVHYDCD